MPYRRKSSPAEGGSRAPLEHESAWPIELATYAALFLAPVAIGSVHLWSNLVLLGLLGVAFGAHLLRHRRSPVRLFPLGALLLAAAGLTALQLVPLPPGLLSFLSPGADEVLDAVRGGTPLAAHWRPLSLAPPATGLELVKILAAALAFLVVVNTFHDRHRARRLLKTIAWTGFAVALVGFFSKLFAARAIFGLYPLPRDTFFFATFVNPNHLAGFLALCSPVALGLALSARERQDRALFGFMGVIIGVAVFMSLSRGGIIAYSAGLLFLLFFAASRRTRRLERLVWAQGLAVAVLLVAGYLAYDTVTRELSTLGDLEAVREETKIRAWGGALEMAADHPVLGIGRGAYATAYPRYKSVPSDATFTHAENQPLQYLAEWGPLFGGLFTLGLIACFALGLGRARQSFSMAGALAGVFAVLLQNLVDFNLETGGVLIPCAALFGVLAASPFSHAGSPSEGETRLRLRRPLAVGLLGAMLVLGAVGAALAARHDLAQNTARLLLLQDGAPAEPCDGSPLGQAACDQLAAYPSDFITPLVLGRAQLMAAVPDLARALHWLNAALLLHPTHAPTHRLVGRALWIGGRKEQALLEYRLSAATDPRLQTAVVAEVLRRTGDPEAAVVATPDDAQAYLATARILRTLGRPEAAARAARLSLERDPSRLPALDLLGELTLAAGHMEEAEALARQAIDIDAQHEPAWVLWGQVHLKRGQPEKAEEAWRAGLAQVPESTLLATRLVEHYLSTGALKEAESVAARLQTFAGSDDRSQARLQVLLGRIKEARGMFFEARGAYRQAVELTPDTLPTLYRLGRMEEKIGNWDEAERIYLQLLEAHYNAEEMRGRIEVVGHAREVEKRESMIKTYAPQAPEGSNAP